MIRPVIVDTGPIVALLDRRETTHKWADEKFRSLPKPLLTCESVLTEAYYLMRPSPNGSLDVLYLVEQGVLKVDYSLGEDAVAVTKLMRKYSDVPMSLADACIVRMSELIGDSLVMTLYLDFFVYHRSRSQPIDLITI